MGTRGNDGGVGNGNGNGNAAAVTARYVVEKFWIWGGFIVKGDG